MQDTASYQFFYFLLFLNQLWMRRSHFLQHFCHIKSCSSSVVNPCVRHLSSCEVSSQFSKTKGKLKIVNI